MLYISSLKKNPQGEIESVKVIYSPEHPEIEMIFPFSQMFDSIKTKQIEYRTAIKINGKFQDGANLHIQNGHLVTSANGTVLDNLGNLPLFE